MNIGIIGVGSITISRHIPDFREAGGKVIALADCVEGRAEKYAKEFRIEFAYDNYKKLLANRYIDAVSITTPTKFHKEIAIDSFKAGKDVYLEKPPTINEIEMKDIVNASKDYGKILFVGSNAIYHNQIQYLKKIISNGSLGGIYSARLSRMDPRRLPHGWLRNKEIAGGGIALEGVSHNLDWILYIMNEPKPVSVTAITYNKFAGYKSKNSYYTMDVKEGLTEDSEIMDVEDSVVSMICFDNGFTLTIEAFRAVNSESKYELNLYGDKGGAYIDFKKCYNNENNSIKIFNESNDNVFTHSYPQINCTQWNHIDAFKHFISCISTNKQTQSNGERCIVIMKIIDAIYESAKENGKQIIL